MLKKIERFLKIVIVPPLVSILMRLIYSTLRVEVEGKEYLDTSKANVFGVWHGDFFSVLMYIRSQKMYNSTVMTSYSDDGEILSRIITTLGGNVVRGDERRYSTRALIGILRRFKEGNNIYFALDGPLGPVKKAKAGVCYASKKLNSPIMLISSIDSKAWVFSSWDRFHIPKPFSKTTIKIKPPFTPSGNDEKDTLSIEKILST